MTPRVETCRNFKPTITVVLTEISMLFIIDLMIPHNGMNSINGYLRLQKHPQNTQYILLSSGTIVALQRLSGV